MLYYTQLSDAAGSRGVFPTPADPPMLASLLMRRNEMVGGCAPHAAADGRMPPMLRSAQQCRFCPELLHCTLTHRAVEGGDARSSGIDALFDAQTAHLSAVHLDYFRHWLELITLEERASERNASELHAISAAARDALGRCLAGMQLRAIDEETPAKAGARERWPHRFARAALGDGGAGGRALNETEISISDYVSISVQPSACGARPARWSVATGVVCDVSVSEVVVLLERPLTECGVAPEPATPAGAAAGAAPLEPPALLLRIDKNELATGFQTCRNNVIQLMAPVQPQPLQPNAAVVNPAAAAGMGGRAAPEALRAILAPGEAQNGRGSGNGGGAAAAAAGAGAGVGAAGGGECSQLLRLVVDMEAPRFGCGRAAVARLPAAEQARLEALNPEQMEAVQRCLGAEDYALILGMPGTGKTTLIAHAVRAMWALGQSVLLSAYTHSALDNILLKLHEMGVPLLRLGAPQRVHPRLREHTLHALCAKAGGTAALQRELAGRAVVGTTALALAHAPLWQRTFDVCVVDEAGQTTEPVCLGPLRLARRFVLVGDHYQLPPLVREARAAARGLGVSLFQRLSDAHPRAVCRLRRQYRMAADIMAVSNALIYGGQLRCGSEAVASAALHLPQPTRTPPPRRHTAGADAAWAEAEAWAASAPSSGSEPRTAQWLPAALEPARRVVFLDTDTAPAPELRSDGPRGNVHNPTEARLVAQLAATCLACGLPPSELALISPYRAQLRSVREHLAAAVGGGDVAVAGGVDGAASGVVGGAVGGASAADEVEVITVDKCQGRDYECVVLSLVRSNGDGSIGALLSDWCAPPPRRPTPQPQHVVVPSQQRDLQPRQTEATSPYTPSPPLTHSHPPCRRRLNVAFSRAKRKLIVVGSRSTLRASHLLGSFISLVEERGWCLELPPNAHLLYDVPSPPLAQPSAPPAGGAAAGERRPRVAPNRPLTANILQHADGLPLPLRLGASTGGGALEW